MLFKKNFLSKRDSALFLSCLQGTSSIFDLQPPPNPQATSHILTAYLSLLFVVCDYCVDLRGIKWCVCMVLVKHLINHHIAETFF